MLAVRECDDLNNIDVSGLDEHEKKRLQLLLSETLQKTPNNITTGKLVIQLKDDQPVAYRSRRLAYAERIQLKRIIGEFTT